MKDAALLAIAFALAGCQADCPEGFARSGDTNCYPIVASDSGSPNTDDSATDDSATDDSATDDSGPSGMNFDIGHPIDWIGRYEVTPMVEWMDAVVLSPEYGLAVGQGGFAVINLDDASLVAYENAERGYRVAYAENTAWVATRARGIYSIDLSDPTEPQRHRSDQISSSYHEDIAADGDLVLIGVQEEGAFLLNASNRNRHATLPATFAFGVGLQGDRALVADDEELVLWNVSDPANPVEITRTALRAVGRDISWEGDRVAVGLGGLGVSMFSTADDQLTPQGDLYIPGSAFSVSLDGDYLWVGGWEVTALAWVGEGGPAVLGHQLPESSSMSIGAGHGKALVADWFFATVLHRIDGLGGPELHMERSLTFAEPGQQRSVRIKNWGASPLELELQPPNDYTLSETRFDLEPGDSRTLTVEAGAQANSGQLRWTSNDPDELEGVLRLDSRDTGVGAPHQDFELPGFIAPDTQQLPYSLSAQRGKVVFLAYFANF